MAIPYQLHNKLRQQQEKQNLSSNSFDFKILQKPLWVWDQKEHLTVAKESDGQCCWNHIVGLPAIKEAGLDWYRNQIKITASLAIDFKPTGAAINEELYPSTSLKDLSTKDIQELADLFSVKIKYQIKQVYTKDPIID